VLLIKLGNLTFCTIHSHQVALKVSFSQVVAERSVGIYFYRHRAHASLRCLIMPQESGEQDEGWFETKKKLPFTRRTLRSKKEHFFPTLTHPKAEK
jgi:hypothetical protein